MISAPEERLVPVEKKADLFALVAEACCRYGMGRLAWRRKAWRGMTLYCAPWPNVFPTGQQRASAGQRRT